MQTTKTLWMLDYRQGKWSNPKAYFSRFLLRAKTQAQPVLP